MPAGRYVSDQYRYVIPRREDMLKDIESLIHHFINVTRGMKMPTGEAYAASEVPRGEQGYYVVSDGLGYPYRLRIRGPGFANVQTIPRIAKGGDHRRPDLHLRVAGLHPPGHRSLRARDPMLPNELRERLERDIREVEHPRELAVDVMFAIQEHYGYLSDEALAEAAALLGHDAARAGRARDLLHLHLPRPGRKIRHPRLRQRRVLDERLRVGAGLPLPHARHPPGGDDRGRAVHAAARLLYRLLRPLARPCSSTGGSTATSRPRRSTGSWTSCRRKAAQAG